jgi:hypothetical protein
MIKKAVLNELIKSYDLVGLEQHLIYAYLLNHQLDYLRSPILATYFDNFLQNPALFFDTSSLEIETIKELENYLELIIPSSDRKLNGAFFTPDYIIDFIINEVKPQSNDKNLRVPMIYLHHRQFL